MGTGDKKVASKASLKPVYYWSSQAESFYPEAKSLGTGYDGK